MARDAGTGRLRHRCLNNVGGGTDALAPDLVVVGIAACTVLLRAIVEQRGAVVTIGDIAGRNNLERDGVGVVVDTTLLDKPCSPIFYHLHQAFCIVDALLHRSLDPHNM